MTPFEKAIKFTLSWEGGYVNDPHDPGGETKYGISKRSYPHLNIKDLTLDEAKGIYRRDYWDKVKGDQLPEKVAISLFDFAVNSGVGTAIAALQRVCQVKADGKIGPTTLRALDDRVNGLGEEEVAIELIQHRVTILINIVHRKATQARFLAGWMNRVFSLIKLLLR